MSLAGSGQEFVGLRIKVRKELDIPSRCNPPRPTNSLNRREAAEYRRRILVFAAQSAAQPGEAGTKNFAGKSESQNSKSETT
jgi:hypothetical protein